MEDFFEKVNFEEKKTDNDNKRLKIPSIQRVDTNAHKYIKHVETNDKMRGFAVHLIIFFSNELHKLINN